MLPSAVEQDPLPKSSSAQPRLRGTRFGYLAFARHDGTRVSLATAAGIRDVDSDDCPCVYDGTTQSLRPLPAEVLHAGRARISGLVHTLGAEHRPLLDCLDENPDVVWPEESGGQARLAQILTRCRDLRQGVAQAVTMSLDDPRLRKDCNCMGVDAMLYDLLEPERRRQRKGFVAAMTQMLKRVESA